MEKSFCKIVMFALHASVAFGAVWQSLRHEWLPLDVFLFLLVATHAAVAGFGFLLSLLVTRAACSGASMDPPAVAIILAPYWIGGTVILWAQGVTVTEVLCVLVVGGVVVMAMAPVIPEFLAAEPAESTSNTA